MSELFVKFISFLIKSNIFISLGASSIAYITLFLMSLPQNPIIIATVFFGFMLIYNLNRLTDCEEDRINSPDRIVFANQYNKPLLLISAPSYAYFSLLVLSVSPDAFIVSIVQIVIGVIYSIFRIKRYFIFKNMIVAITWGATALFSGIYYNRLDTSLMLFFLIFTLQFFVNNMIFDIKDIKGDRACNIKTIPNTFGARKTIRIGYIINTLSVLILISNILNKTLTGNSVILLPLLFYVYMYLYIYGRISDRIYYGLLVDGEFVFIAIIAFLYGVYHG